ncbi:hypothetical protein [Hwanghaeella sp. LZ110]|uniref:hypothetical protein n=1 Tax=Hwanghaeella sp. LZ110 TaxID=3402810 RepID=UPI003B673278
MKKLLIFIALAVMIAGPTQAETTVNFGYLSDPSHEAILWAIKNGRITSDKIKVEATALEIPALIQETIAQTYDVIETAAIAIPRARSKGLDLRIIGTGL